jgi:Bacterial PH domain
MTRGDEPPFVSERLPRWFAVLTTVYFGFLAVFVPFKQFSSWVKHVPASAVDVYLVIVAAALILGCFRGWRMGLHLDGNGVTVRNYFRTYHIGWPEVKCLADGNAGLQLGGNGQFAWALSVMTHDGRPVVASATTRYSGQRSETLTAIGQHAELHGIAADLAGVAQKLRPRRRNFVGDLLVWTGILLAAWYPLSLLASATHCTTC